MKSTVKLPTDLWFTEQVEALAIAIAMALVLKFFVIEAYQIPTGSMQPTILGDRVTGIKDRVIADKLSTMLRAPRRWEVMIFRFPNDERRLYVKRIVGLPGEVLEIRGGDLWVDGKVARKPDKIANSVLKTLFPGYDDGIDIGRVFSKGEGITLYGQEAAFAADAQGVLRLRGTVYAKYDHGYDPDWGIRASMDGPEAVSDLEVCFEATLDEGADGISISFSADDGERHLFIPSEGSGQRARVTFHPASAGPADGNSQAGSGHPGEIVYLDDGELSVPAGRRVSITARHMDRQLLLKVDGDEWLRFDEDQLGPLPRRPLRARVSLGITGGGRLGAVVLRRDIFYTQRYVPDSHWEIPLEHYFALGDNTQSSLDCRGFAQRTYRVRQPDGSIREIAGFAFEHYGPGPGAPDQNPRKLPGGQIQFADLHGDTYTFSTSDIVPQGEALFSETMAPFIHERYLLGKVLWVFWPIYDPFRWKLVH